MAACSKHFQEIFETTPLGSSLIVILDGTSSTNIASLLEFMYRGEVQISQERLTSFLKTADNLQVKTQMVLVYLSKCYKYNNVPNCVSLYVHIV